jgi:hypothetical protein
VRITKKTSQVRITKEITKTMLLTKPAESDTVRGPPNTRARQELLKEQRI